MPLASSRSASQKRAEMVEQEKKAAQRRERRLSSSFPTSCASTTVVNAAKARRRLSLRKQGSQSSLVDSANLLPENNNNRQDNATDSDEVVKKENAAPKAAKLPPAALDSPSHRPTPYWKVAAERGMSPPETRSATKKKQKPSSDEDSTSRSGGVALFFSPPNQEANAQREQAVLQAKETRRASRVERARQSGQLLLFSPSGRPLNLLNDSDDDGSPRTEQDMDVEVAQTDDNHDDDDDGRAISMEVQVGNSPGTFHDSMASSEEVTGLIKQLLEQVQQNDGRNQAKELLVELQKSNNQQLEQSNRELRDEVKTITVQWRTDKEDFLVKTTRLELELEKAQKQVESLRALEEQLANVQGDKSQQLIQIQQLQEQLTARQLELDDYKSKLASLREHNRIEQDQLRNHAKELEQANVKLSSELATVQQAREQLVRKVEDYDRTIQKREKELKEAQHLLEQLQRQLQSKDDTLNTIQQASSGHESTIVSLKNEIQDLQDALREQKRQLSDQEHQSSLQLKEMTSQLEDKNAMIGDLYRQLGDKEKELQAMQKEWNQTKEALEGVQNEQAKRIAELNSALDGAVSQLDDYDAAKIELRDKVAELERLLEEGQQRSDTKEHELRSIQLELDTMEKELSILRQERDEAQRMFVEQSHDKTATSAQLRSIEASYKEMEGKLKSKQSQQAHQITQLEHENQSLKQRLKASELERDEARSNMVGFNEREAELYRKLQESDRIRRDLHSRVMQLTGNIRVYVRVRPPLSGESDDSSSQSDSKKRTRDDNDSPFSFPGIYDRESKSSRSSNPDDATKNLIVATEPYKDRGGLSDRRKTWKFAFDNIFSPHHGQDDVWEATLPLVQSAIDGYNVTIFAYGQTGSGKTYTMLGDETNPGIVGRAVRKLFESKRELEDLSQGSTEVQMSVEMLEIYNEKVRDLLDPDGESNRNEQSLKITSKEVVGNVLVPTESESEVMELVALAQDRRCVKATVSNAESSRSHLLFTINYDVKTKDGSTRNGKLNICDLAGSERLSKSGAHHVGGALLEETKNINKSLSVLSNVIERLQAGEKTIPFRESKLTQILQNSLSGNSKTLAIVCCNPLTSHFHESLCSLRFAEKVNKCELKAVNSFSC